MRIPRHLSLCTSYFKRLLSHLVWYTDKKKSNLNFQKIKPSNEASKSYSKLQTNFTNTNYHIYQCAPSLDVLRFGWCRRVCRTNFSHYLKWLMLPLCHWGPTSSTTTQKAEAAATTANIYEPNEMVQRSNKHARVCKICSANTVHTHARTHSVRRTLTEDLCSGSEFECIRSLGQVL